MSIARSASDWVGRLIAMLASERNQSSDVLLHFLQQYIKQNQGSSVSFTGIYVARPELVFVKKIVTELVKLQGSDNEVRMTRLMYLLNSYSLNRLLPMELINFFRAYFSVFEIYKLYCSTPLLKQLGGFHVWRDYLTQHLAVLLASLGDHLQDRKFISLSLLHHYADCLLPADRMQIYQILHDYLLQDHPREGRIEKEIYSLVRAFKGHIPECYHRDIINGLFKRVDQHKDEMRYEALKTIVVLQDWLNISEQADIYIRRFLNELSMVNDQARVFMGLDSLYIFAPFISSKWKRLTFDIVALLIEDNDYTYASIQALELLALIARDLPADYHGQLSALICEILNSGNNGAIINVCLALKHVDFLSAEHFQPIEDIHMSMLFDEECGDDVHCPLLSSMSHLFSKFTTDYRELYLEVLVSTIHDVRLSVNRRYCAIWAFKMIAEMPGLQLIEQMLASMQSVFLSPDNCPSLRMLALEIIKENVRFLMPHHMAEMVDAISIIINGNEVDVDLLKVTCTSLHCFPSVMESQDGLDFVNRHIEILNDEKATVDVVRHSCAMLAVLKKALSENKKQEVIDVLLSLAAHENRLLRYDVYDALLVYGNDMTMQQKIVALSLAQQLSENHQAKRLYAIIFTGYQRDVVRTSLMSVPTTVEDYHLNQDCADHVLRFM